MNGLPTGQESEKSVASSAAEPIDSGHSKCRKFRFSATLTSIFTGWTIIFSAKDYYLEKFGAHPLTMGIIFFIVSFLTPLGEILSGRLQNREALKRWFPVNVYGRKAPWLLTHVVVVALACAALYIPPMRSNKALLHAWFFVVSVIMFWAVSTTIIAFESARQEIYPYNEERSQVEMYSKIACMLGIGYGMVPMLVLLADSGFMLRLGASVFWFVGVIVFGMQAKPIWLEATSTSKSEERSILHDLKESWKSVAFRHLCMVRLYDGFYQGFFATNLFYYLTYILQMHGVERSGFLVLVGLASGAGELGMASYVAHRLKERKFQFQLQDFVIRNRVLCSATGIVLLVAPPFLFGHKKLEKDSQELNMTRACFLLWAASNRVFQAPFTFWRVGAQCWVIDEDIHEARETTGVRREAAFISALSAAQNFARALGSAVIFLGYGFAGLNPTDCDSQCQDTWSAAGHDSLSDCNNDCTGISILSQPDSLRLYIRGCFVIGLNICDLLIILHAIAFPIKGIRLARLYNNQTLALGGKINGIYTGKKSAKGVAFTPQEIVDKTHGKSTIVRMDCDAEAGIDQVNRMSPRHNSPKPRAISASVVFTLPDSEVASPSSHFGALRIPAPLAPLTLLSAVDDAAIPEASLTSSDFVASDSSEIVIGGGLRQHLSMHSTFVRSPMTSAPRLRDPGGRHPLRTWGETVQPQVDMELDNTVPAVSQNLRCGFI